MNVSMFKDTKMVPDLVTCDVPDNDSVTESDYSTSESEVGQKYSCGDFY